MAEEGELGARQAGPGFWTKRAARLGAYQDDSFRGLRCGYQFGLRLAQQGNRLAYEREPAARTAGCRNRRP